MRQYFTYVNPYVLGAHHPIEYYIENSLGDLWPCVKHNFCVAQGSTKGDPRLLGYIELEVDEQGYTRVPTNPNGKDGAAKVMNMILGLFTNKLESVEEAKDKIERWTNRSDISILNDKVVVPLI